MPATGRLRCSHSPQRESKNVQPCGIQPAITAERKKAHMPPVTPYFTFVRNGRGFYLFLRFNRHTRRFSGRYRQRKAFPLSFFFLLYYILSGFTSLGIVLQCRFLHHPVQKIVLSKELNFIQIACVRAVLPFTLLLCYKSGFFKIFNCRVHRLFVNAAFLGDQPP